MDEFKPFNTNELNSPNTIQTNNTNPGSYNSIKPPFLAEKRDRLLVLFAILIGYAFFEMIFFSKLGLGVVIFTVLLYVLVHLYGSKLDTFRPSSGALLYLPITLLLLCFFLFSNMLLAFFNFLLLFFLVILHLMSMFGVRSQTKWTKLLFADFLQGTFVAPFSNADKIFRCAASKSSDKKSQNTLLKIFLTLVLILPVAAIVLMLLSSADSQFQNLINDIFNRIFVSADLTRQFTNIIMGCIGAIFVFSALYSFRHRTLKPVNTNHSFVNLKTLDQTIGITILVLFCAIYILFLIVQFNYLFLGLAGKLPGTFVYAEYARRGFFELLVVSFINLGLLGFTHIFSRNTNNLKNRFHTMLEFLLSSLSIVLIVSALSKMVMYIQAYNLTPLRVYTSWFMLLLACIFILFIIKLFAPRFKAFKTFCITFLTLYLALNLACVDAQIAKYNINRYQDNPQGMMLDMGLLDDLSSSAVPYIADLKDNDNPYISSAVKSILCKYNPDIKPHRPYIRYYSDFNLADYRAVQEAREFNEERESNN